MSSQRDPAPARAVPDSGTSLTDANQTCTSWAGAQAMLTKDPRLGSNDAAQGISARGLVIWGTLALVTANEPIKVEDLGPFQSLP